MMNAEKFWSWVDNRIFNSFRPGPYFLAGIRMLYSFYFLFFLVDRLDWLGTYPNVFYEPPLGIPRLFSGFPPEWFFHGLAVLAVVFLTGLLIGYQTRLCSLGIGLVVLLFTSFLHSFGKINHMSLFIFFPIVMSFTNWGAVLSVDENLRGKPGRVRHWPLTLLAVLVAFSLFTSGAAKVTTGWLDLSTQAVESKLYSSYYAYGRTELLAEWFFNLKAPWLWELLDWAVVAFELLALPLVFFPRMFRVALGFFVLFHLMVLLMLNIDFSILIPVYGTFASPALSRRILFRGRGAPDFLRKIYRAARPWWAVVIAAPLIWLMYNGGAVFEVLPKLIGIQTDHFTGLVWWSLAAAFVVAGAVLRISDLITKRKAG